MAYQVIHFRVKRLGFCCPRAYFAACRSIPTSDIAIELGVHKRTARKWRAAFNAGKIPCIRTLNCFNPPDA